jgi:hypothetical protein
VDQRWTAFVDLVHWFTVDRPKGVTPDLIQALDRGSSGWGRLHAIKWRRMHLDSWMPIQRLASCAREGMAADTPEGAAHGGGLPELRRRRRPGATVHQNACGLDRAEEENGAKLTRCSMTVVGRCRRRAAKRGGRDHGRSPGR